jgi:nicotinamide mononucleotide adenylyltransferase
MMNYIAKADKQTSTMNKQYAMYCGRWQPLNPGHQYIFQESLDLGKNVLICIRDVKPDEKNPYTAEEVKANIENHYAELIKEERVKVMIIPDICSINYGRGVGYDIIEHVVPKEISDISATKIRQEMKEKGLL